jgi:hypothetical protein
MSTPEPFIVGRHYRVKKTVSDYFSRVEEGQILSYLCRGFAPYDAMWCFNFLDPKGERLYWCIHEDDSVEKWRDVFEEMKEPIQPPQTTTGSSAPSRV